MGRDLNIVVEAAKDKETGVRRDMITLNNKIAIIWTLLCLFQQLWAVHCPQYNSADSSLARYFAITRPRSALDRVAAPLDYRVQCNGGGGNVHQDATAFIHRHRWH